MTVLYCIFESLTDHAMNQKETLTAPKVNAKTPIGVIGKPFACGAFNIPTIMEQETWKDIPGYEGMYQVSSLGRIKSLQRIIMERRTQKQRPITERILKQGKNIKGYYCFAISKEGKLKSICTHRIVAELFIPNPLGLPEVNHKDEIKSNNRADNLEWCTHHYNILYGTGLKRLSDKLTGRQNKYCQGENSPSSKLKNYQVLAIYSDQRKYKEICKEYGVVESCISRIKHKKAWSFLLNSIK
jgi:hypothetical protein